VFKNIPNYNSFPPDSQEAAFGEITLWFRLPDDLQAGAVISPNAVSGELRLYFKQSLSYKYYEQYSSE